MSRTATRLAQILGVALIVSVLWLVGWNDRVTDRNGLKYVGSVESFPDATHVILKTGGGRETIDIEDAQSVRRGLGGPFSTLRQNPGWLLLGLGVHLLGFFATFSRWFVLLAGAGLATPLRRVLRLGWIGSFFSVVIPGGIASGDAVKSVYLIRTHPEKKTRAIVTVFMDRLTGLAMLCGIAAVAVVFAPKGSRIEQVARSVVLALLGLSALGALVLFSGRVRRILHVPNLAERLPFQRIVTEIRHALAIYGKRRWATLGASLAALLAHGLMLLAFFFYAQALGTDLSLVAVGAAIPVAQMLAAVPGLPGGWGVGDFAMFFFLPAVGVSAGQAVALSFVYRMSHTLLSMPGGLMLATGEKE